MRSSEPLSCENQCFASSFIDRTWDPIGTEYPGYNRCSGNYMIHDTEEILFANRDLKAFHMGLNQEQARRYHQNAEQFMADHTGVTVMHWRRWKAFADGGR